MNNDWLFFNVSSRRIQKRKETFHTPKISFNSSIIKTTVVKKAEPFFSQVVHYTNTNAALHGNSIFVNHTYDNHISFPTYHDPTWKDVQYFPWNDNLNYTEICKNVLKRITRNDTYYIISGSFNGGLGHKYLSVYHSITYAILLGRRFLRTIFNDILSSESTRKFLERNKQLFSTLAVLWRIQRSGRLLQRKGV